MFRGWREGSLQSAIISLFTLLVAAVLLVVMFGFTEQTRKATQDDAMDQARQSVSQGNSSLDVYISSAFETMQLFKCMVQGASDVRSLPLTGQMTLIKRQFHDIACLSVFSAGGELLNTTEGSTDLESSLIRDAVWFQRTNEARRTSVSISDPYLQVAYNGQYAWVVTLSTQISYRRMGKIEPGVLAMSLHFSGIEDILKDIRLGKSGYMYLMGQDQDLIYHAEKPLIRLGLWHENTELVRTHVFGSYFDELEGRERYVVIQTVNHTRWRLVGVVYMDEAMTAMREPMRMILLFLAAGILMALSVSILMGWMIARPMNRLTRIMRAVEGGNLDVEIQEHGFLEITNLARAFRLMLGRIKLLMHQIMMEQEQKRLYELDALQAQINPHFLYNTLDSIVWMQERGQNKDAIRMVTALARLFRISISKGRNIITVAEEIEHARNYLIIQSIRFKNQFTYSIDVQPEVLRMKTIKLILQPLVENAIAHGLAHFTADEGLIEISAKAEGEQLIMRVRDNGLGMSQEEAKTVLNAHKGSVGIGLSNVHERIVLTYGEGYGITIISEQDEGTEVTIRQPAMLEEETP